MLKSKITGFSLIEIVATMAIIGILAAMALPSYYTYLLETRRTDAYVALTLAAAEQERAYAINSAFTSDMAELGGSQSEEGFYTLGVTVNEASYVLTATATTNGVQAGDSGCLVLTLNHLGIKTPAECW